MKRNSLLLTVTLAVLVAFAIGSIVLAGDPSTTKDSKAKNASTSDKACAKICKDKATCSKDKAACAKTCTNADGKAKGQCTDACKADCKDKAACTKHTSGACNPKDCKPGTCDPKDCPGHSGK